MENTRIHKLPYDEKDIVSIFNYSKKLVGRTLRDFVHEYHDLSGKGGLGQLVEKLYFKYDINSRQEADFAFVNAELKCTPLKKSRENELLIKERLVCSMINYQEDWDKAFENSHFYQKCLIMLLLFYLHNPSVPKLDLEFVFAVLWKIPEKGEKRPKYLMLENVDRLLNSPATQRGRDFAIILASLSDLGYTVEWRVINAAEYGMPQRRRRTYIVAYKDDTNLHRQFYFVENKFLWVLHDGVMAQAFACEQKNAQISEFEIKGNLVEVSKSFNVGMKTSPFGNSGVMSGRKVYSLDTTPIYNGHYISLGEVLVDDESIPESFYISEEDLPKWEYQKGQKSLKRVNKTTGYEYNYSEGAMAFPDALDKASRTIITGEGGAGPSRFKHIIKTKSGRYRRLVPVELERLNMFPDNHTFGASDMRRAFLMGNALVTGIVEDIALVLKNRM